MLIYLLSLGLLYANRLCKVIKLSKIIKISKRISFINHNFIECKSKYLLLIFIKIIFHSNFITNSY